MYLTILGRQPDLSAAELEQVFGHDSITHLSNEAAVVKTDDLNINRLGGIQKAGVVVHQTKTHDWPVVSKQIVDSLFKELSQSQKKITLGISVYGLRVAPKEVQKTGIVLKKRLKTKNVSLRLIPNKQSQLSTATSHHNKLGLSDNKMEILVACIRGITFIATSTGAQNITAYAHRDQNRPKRDAFVGMLPPKLAQIMVNLAVGDKNQAKNITVLDPFCGTGVLLQEAILMGYQVYGTDLSEKMISYSRTNLEWIAKKSRVFSKCDLHQGDAMTTKWKEPISIVASEAYLGQPFSAPPSPAKLKEVIGNCNHIVKRFLVNISSQLDPSATLCIAVPSWRNKDGGFSHLPLLRNLEELGYKYQHFTHVDEKRLMYYRDNQVVARELLVLTKI